MSRRVQFAPDMEYDDDRIRMKREKPTPRAKKSGRQSLGSSSSSEGGKISSRRVHFARKYDNDRIPMTPHAKKSGRRQSRGSLSSSEGEEEISFGRSTATPKIRRSRRSLGDGRGSPKERKRKSEVARSLPRRADGTFASGNGSPRFDESSYKTPPRRSPIKHFFEESEEEESFLNTTPPRLPAGRYIKEFVQTPQGQRMRKQEVVRSARKGMEGMGGRELVNFDDEVSEDEEEEVSFLTTTPPRLPAGRYIKEFFRTPEGQRMIKKELMVTLNEMGGSLLDYDDDDDASDADYQEEESEDGNDNPTPPRSRRSSRSGM